MIRVGGTVTGSVLIDEVTDLGADGPDSVLYVTGDGLGGGATFAGVSGFTKNGGASVGDSGVNEGEKGVTAPASKKPNPSRWVPGQSGNPLGRQIRKYDKAYLSAIAETIPPEKMPELLEAALDVARSKGSWRGYLEIARFVAEYQIGKPVQRIHSVTSKMESILNRLESVQIVDGDVMDAGDEGEDTL